MVVAAWEAFEDLDGIVGGTCSVVCQPVALIAAALNVPMVSSLCSSGYLSDKTVYPTFTRSVGTWIKNSFTFDATMDAFGYFYISVIAIFVVIVVIIVQSIYTLAINA